MSSYGVKRTTNPLMMPLDADRLIVDLHHLKPKEAGVYFNLLVMAWRWGNPVAYSRTELLRILWVSGVGLTTVLDGLAGRGFVRVEGDEIFLLKMEDHTTAPSRRPLDRYTRAVIFERDGTKCRYCGATEGVSFVIDHIVPWIRGGDDAHENLCVACSICNASKGDKLLDEWKPS